MQDEEDVAVPPQQQQAREASPELDFVDSSSTDNAHQQQQEEEAIVIVTACEQCHHTKPVVVHKLNKTHLCFVCAAQVVAQIVDVPEDDEDAAQNNEPFSLYDFAAYSEQQLALESTQNQASQACMNMAQDLLRIMDPIVQTHIKGNRVQLFLEEFASLKQKCTFPNTTIVVYVATGCCCCC